MSNIKIKKYCIYGFVERYVTAKLGKGSISFHFKDGIADASGVTPATYVTKNPLEHSIIESHPDFKNGTIRLLDVQIVEPVVETAPKVTAEDITTLTAARQYLMEQHGATVEELQSKAAVLEWAAKHDIVFPNYK